ncbi:MAG: RodZ domain-containing protein [Thermoanaerobaculia bacterium]
MKVETPRDFGDELRRERELREVTREQLALVTKVSVRQIEALETGRFEILPALVFSRGFVRAIALHLGLDPERTVAAYRHVFEMWEASRPKETLPVPPVRPMSDTIPTQLPRRTVASSTMIRAVAVTATLVIATGIAILAKSRAPEPRRGAAPGPTRAESGPASLALPQAVAAATVALPAGASLPGRPTTSAAAQAPSGTSTMTLHFRDDCWTEVLVDGKVAVRSLFPKGTTREFGGGRTFTLTLGNAGGVDVTIDGRAIPPIGRPGEVVKSYLLDPAATR